MKVSIQRQCAELPTPLLRRAGELSEDTRLRLYRTDTEALQALRELAPLPADMAAAAI